MRVVYLKCIFPCIAFIFVCSDRLTEFLLPSVISLRSFLSVGQIKLIYLSNLVVFPVQDGDPSKWPFVINTASDSRVISKLVAGNSMSAAYEGKQTVSWTFTVSGEAKTGLYPLTFKYQYYSNGKLTSGTITTFANIHGASENGKLIDNGEDTNTSTPRIIVTGFTTDPENVQAGDSFTLNL